MGGQRLNIDELRYFVEAAKEQNFSRAAQTLGITQSTLSHAVSRLETEFGRRLSYADGTAEPSEPGRAGRSDGEVGGMVV